MSDSIHISPAVFSQDLLDEPPPSILASSFAADNEGSTGSAKDSNARNKNSIWESDAKKNKKVKDQYWLFTGLMIAWTIFVVTSIISYYFFINLIYVQQTRGRIELADSLHGIYRQWVFDINGIYAKTPNTSENLNGISLKEIDIKEADNKKSDNKEADNKETDNKEKDDKNTDTSNNLIPVEVPLMTHLINKMPAMKENSMTLKLTRPGAKNPENIPDEWETEAYHELKSARVKEKFKLEYTNGHAFVRLARPMYLTKACLQCHADQSEGDMYGIVSTSIEADELSGHRFKNLCVGFITLTFLWLFGFLSLAYLKQREEQYRLTLNTLVNKEAAIEKYKMQLEELVAERTADLREAVRSVELANTAKSQFLAHMSHEIRTPLNGVLGLTNLLSNEQLSDKQAEYVKMICLSGETLLSLINDILDFSKIEAGMLELDKREFDLFDKLESLLGIMSTRFLEKELEFCLDVSPGVPRVVIGDGNRLLQILINFAGNSVKFTTKGGVRISMECVELRSGNDAVLRFRIADTGIGIEKAQLSRLFKSYSQADSSIASKFGGTGLGLTIARHLVRMMGGDVSVSSEPGVGTIFDFTVIMNVPPEQVKLMWDNPVPSITSMSDLPTIEGIRVLVVVDNSVMTASLKTQLGYWKMKVDIVSTKEGIEEKLYPETPDEDPIRLIIWDEGFTQLEIVDYIGKIRGSEKTADISVVLLLMMVDRIDPVLSQVLKIVTVKKPFCISALYDAILMALFKNKVADFFARKDTDKREAKNKSHIVRQLKFLIAEDNTVNQVVITEMLRTCGHHCEVVGDGNKAVEKFKSDQTLDFILMDCQMPELDGYEATKQIREIEKTKPIENGIAPHIPIIALTANATVEDRTRCIDSGMDDFCSKPVKQDTLFAIVNKILLKKDSPNDNTDPTQTDNRTKTEYSI
ncbi:MAG: response regulator [Planctomycetaceae bacterium]|jgi:signal transduction histidine kinase/CheY-like chemotaxis protein|nr:response regulator [Planctomycetaceae bacterium]